MASIDIQKQTIQSMAGMLIHFDPEKRADPNVHHSNKNIDPTKAHLNYHLSCTSYLDAYQRAKAKIAEIDEKHPPIRKKKDRICFDTVELKCPEWLEDSQEDFFQMADDFLKDYFGDNYFGMEVHLDEKHNYIDHDEDKVSLFHGHALVVPYAKWTEKDKTTGKMVEREGINSKHFNTRNMLRDMQTKFNKKFKERYGQDYQTGAEARKMTVEELKAESAKETLRIKQERLKAESDIIKLNDKAKQAIPKLKRTEDKITENESLIQTQDEIIKTQAKEIENLKAEQITRQLQVDDLKKEVAEYTTKNAELKQQNEQYAADTQECFRLFGKIKEMITTWFNETYPKLQEKLDKTIKPRHRLEIKEIQSKGNEAVGRAQAETSNITLDEPKKLKFKLKNIKKNLEEVEEKADNLLDNEDYER